jgi:hypothetical protein
VAREALRLPPLKVSLTNTTPYEILAPKRAKIFALFREIEKKIDDF